MKEKIKKIIRFITNPRLFLCIALAWLITNGWSYILFAIGTAAKIHWMTAVAGAYIAFLWLPISPEKIVTFAIALGLLKLLFPNDQKTLAVLRQLYHRAGAAAQTSGKGGAAPWRRTSNRVRPTSPSGLTARVSMKPFTTAHMDWLVSEAFSEGTEAMEGKAYEFV